MATKRVFKTIFEIAEERAAAQGKLEGELKGKLKILRKIIFYILKTNPLTDAQIAEELDTDEAFVKTVRQEFMASKQQG
jgi:predicted transposase YdaD